LNRTEPALITSECPTDFHESSEGGMSLMISASHSTRTPSGPRATQCERKRSVTWISSR
jgi:hypothetical protein